MSSLLEQYCDVTESMAFKTSQLNASTSFNTASSRHMIHDRLKCFNCFGIPDKQQFCDHCGGTNFVTDNHPLALLFNEVFQRKLGKTATLKDPVWGDFQDVDTITEQQEQLDQRKIICDMCNKECDINYKYFCQCCQCFFVCQKCAEQKGDEINHPHPLATNKKLANHPLMLKKTSSNNYGSNRKSENNSQGGNHSKRNKTDDQVKCKLQFFNVCDIIEKQISHTYGNVAQNISCDPSESISAHEFGMMESLGPYQFKLLQLQGSDKGIKPTRQNVQQEGKLTRSVNPSSNSFFNYDITIQQRQSMDFNIIGQDSIRKSVGNRQSFGFDYETYILQHCNNCGAQLKDIYTICRTCQKNDENYKICCQCQDKNLFTHQKDHFMEVMLGNLLGRNSQMVSKKLIDSQEDQEVQSPKLEKKRSSLEQRPPRLDQAPFEQQIISGKESFTKLKSSGSLGMSVDFGKQTKLKNFGEQSVVNLDCEGLFNSTDLSQQLQTIRLGKKKSSLELVNNSMEHIPHPSRFNHAKNKPKVGFAQIGSDDDNVQIAFVQSDSDHEESHHFQSHKYEQVTIKSSRSSYKGFKSVKSMIFSKNQDHSMVSQSHEVIHQTIKYSQSSINYTQKFVQRQYQSQLVEDNTQESKQKVEYIFHQYCCDQCGCNPIKNVRYHCLECENFDVCQNCYGVELKCNHNHEFQKIDGLKKLIDKKNMMLQKKDLNKGKDLILRNSNVGLLAKSKKQVDIMKRNVQQLGSSISNLQSSYSSYNDFFSQKFSFKTKVQF